jgi:hypothetical protein
MRILRGDSLLALLIALPIVLHLPTTSHATDLARSRDPDSSSTDSAEHDKEEHLGRRGAQIARMRGFEDRIAATARLTAIRSLGKRPHGLTEMSSATPPWKFGPDYLVYGRGRG